MTTTREVAGIPFDPGLYRHTKSGGLYTALGVVRHHETGGPMVIYYSHTHGSVSTRPLYGFVGPRCADPDGFAERFELITKSPSIAVQLPDAPAIDRWRSETLLRNFDLLDAALLGIHDEAAQAAVESGAEAAARKADAAPEGEGDK